MFFRKKKTDAHPESSASSASSDPRERREHYRVRPRRAQAIRVSLERESGTSLRGECVEISIGGTWVEFEGAQDTKLEQGEQCSLGLHADAHPDVVRATSRVVNVLRLEDGRIRVGFQFLNRIELYAQLDEFYARCFNRRRHVRVAPGYDVRIPVEISWGTGSLAATAHDLSECGMGVVIPLDKAKGLAKVDEMDLKFRLPKERADVVCRALIRSRTKFEKTCLLGIEFTAGGGIENHLAPLRRCIEKQLAAFEAWNAKLGKAALSKRAS
jgi:c-di-GMP-binding flagellar brake protein YcgR